MGDDDTHVWNLVVINGDAYHLDVTWNDTHDNGYHPYFNITTEEAGKSRTIDDQLGNIPICTATKDNFYRRNGIYLADPNRTELARMLATRVRQGETVIELQLTADSYEDCVYFLTRSKLTTREVNRALDNAGIHELRMWEYTLFSLKEHHQLFLHKK